MGGTKSKKSPSDGPLSLWSAVVIPLVAGLVMGPGCGAVIGGMYGQTVEGLITGLILVGVACLVVLPAAVKRGMSR